jgi:hypothetical protein
VSLGGGGSGWKSYQLCAPEGQPSKEVMFQPAFQSPKAPPSWGMNPSLYQFPSSCTITLTANSGRNYQFTILMANNPLANYPTSPPYPPPTYPSMTKIWPDHSGGVFDKTVVACPSVPTKSWCNQMNELAIPGNGSTPPNYSLLGAALVPN